MLVISVFHIYNEYNLLYRILSLQQEGSLEKVEYRVWNPFRSKLAAAIVGGIGNIYMPPGSKVLYLGAANGTTVSHVSDIVGPVSIFLYSVFMIILLFRYRLIKYVLILSTCTWTSCQSMFVS